MSKTSNEIRNIVLRSYDINASNTITDYWNLTVTTPAGIVTDNRTTMTWNNVNLRQMMGDAFYNKFNKFHIRLNTFYQGQTPQSFVSNNNPSQNARSVDIYMSGLAFDPAPYNQGSSTKSAGRVQIGSSILPQLGTTIGLGVGAVTNYAYGQSPSFTFSKIADSPTITIQIVMANSQVAYVPPIAAERSYGHTEFNFEIHGIPNDESATIFQKNLIR